MGAEQITNIYGGVAMNVMMKPAKSSTVGAGSPRAIAKGKGPALVIAYLNDPIAVDGPGTLFRQKVMVDASAAKIGRTITAYRIDSGRRVGDVVGVRLAELLEQPWRGTLLVADLGVFSADPVIAAHVASTFARRGVRVLTPGAVALEVLDTRL
jgi:hypothetical protein